MLFKRNFVLAVCASVLCACGEPGSVRLGFIGGLSNQNLDNGLSGLNGVKLAVEQANRAGGIHGRPIELVVRDDTQNSAIAKAAARQLLNERVEAVIGPFTSSMAANIVPVMAENQTLVISPTITSMEFNGKDDNLIRINRTTRDNAHDYAALLAQRGNPKIAIAYDLRNRNFTESWLAEFQGASKKFGNRILTEVGYTSDDEVDFASVAKQLLASKPEALLFISGALDVARLAREVRVRSRDTLLVAVEWAATDSLIELGGDVVDGLVIALNYDQDDQSPHYKAFSDAHFLRYQKRPSYSTVSAYDAATVVIEALKKQSPRQTLKDALLTGGPYQGLQQQISFDQYGDTNRKVYFSEIRSGKYQKIR